MAYKFYTDKSEQFECTIDIKNASLKNAVARLVLENSDLTVVFNGNIHNGKCTIPVKKLDGILKEDSTGNVKLEVIVDGMYFSPWESPYTVDRYNAIKVEVVEQKQSKPTVNLVEVKTSIPTQKPEPITPKKEVKPEQKSITVQKSTKDLNKKKLNEIKSNIIDELDLIGIDKTNFKDNKKELEEVIIRNLPKNTKADKEFIRDIIISLQ